MTQIICKDLSLGYDGNVITENLNFSVNEGDYLCIVGENGSGKTTLIKTLLNLTPPLSGEILMCNDITPSQIGYMPQRTDIQKDFPASVMEVVTSGCIGSYNKLRFRKKRKKLVEYNIKRLGIESIASKSFRNLSGGQQQRVFLARALCSAKNLLLLDEPVSGLDPKITTELYSILKQLNEEENMTIIMVSHDIDAALKYATHILHIGQEKSFIGSVSEYHNSQIIKSFSDGGLKNE